jgi:hypothetical protein
VISVVLAGASCQEVEAVSCCYADGGFLKAVGILVKFFPSEPPSSASTPASPRSLFFLRYKDKKQIQRPRVIAAIVV